MTKLSLEEEVKSDTKNNHLATSTKVQSKSLLLSVDRSGSQALIVGDSQTHAVMQIRLWQPRDGSLPTS